jgi:hypothetical protein
MTGAFNAPFEVSLFVKIATSKLASLPRKFDPPRAVLVFHPGLSL